MKKLLLSVLVLGVCAPLLGAASSSSSGSRASADTASENVERIFEQIFAVLDPINDSIRRHAALSTTDIARYLENLKDIQQMLKEFQLTFEAFSAQLKSAPTDAVLCGRLFRIVKTVRVATFDSVDRDNSAVLLTKVAERITELNMLASRMENILRNYDRLPAEAFTTRGGAVSARVTEDQVDDDEDEADEDTGASWFDSYFVQGAVALFSFFTGEYLSSRMHNGQSSSFDGASASSSVSISRRLPDSDGDPMWRIGKWS